MYKNEKKYFSFIIWIFIKFFKNIDCYTSEFSLLFDEKVNPECADRFKRTKLAFVSLGNDDKNIEISIKLRTMFDRLLSVSKKQQEAMAQGEYTGNDMPIIQAVVFDDKKAKKSTFFHIKRIKFALKIDKVFIMC